MRIIPAIDLMDGQCVRLEKGDFAKRSDYSLRPVEMAAKYEKAGLRYLHLVDLDGAKAGKVIHTHILKEITQKTSLRVDFGGGIKTEEDVEKLLQAGASQLSVGSIAVREPQRFKKWLKNYGADKFILAADVAEGKVKINGWKEDTGILLRDLLNDFLAEGLQYVMITDIMRDGMLQGSAIELYSHLTQEFLQLRFIASGGVASAEELPRLQSIGIDGTIIGKALYEGHISLKDLSDFQAFNA